MQPSHITFLECRDVNDWQGQFRSTVCTKNPIARTERQAYPLFSTASRLYCLNESRSNVECFLTSWCVSRLEKTSCDERGLGGALVMGYVTALAQPFEPTFFIDFYAESSITIYIYLHLSYRTYHERR